MVITPTLILKKSLVKASLTYQVKRAEFDNLLAQEAINQGAREFALVIVLQTSQQMKMVMRIDIN
ncbi:hypothetical protein ACOBV8_19810 (plasmid) [Pseudoalteromonas espejiana]